MEIERKFLLTNEAWRDGVTGSDDIVQFYLTTGVAKANVRVRILNDRSALLTIKAAASGITREEFEYEIPLEDARRLQPHAMGKTIEKRRHRVPQGDLVWEIDVFRAPVTLTMAEVELPSEDTHLDLPDWVGREVTGERRYYNAAMARLGQASQ